MANMSGPTQVNGANQRDEVKVEFPSQTQSISSDERTEQEIQQIEQGYLHGWRLVVSAVGLYIGIFLSSLEISIVSTALIPIANDLRIFGEITWVVNAYLLTYTGFLIIWAQFSAIFGRKSFVILANIFFIAFSAGCASAQTANQLIVLRAMQGIGGGGLFNMAMVVLSDAVHPDQFPKYVSLVAVSSAIAFALGPLIGGAITDHTTWRWIFWINVPASAIALLLNAIAIPNRFPKQNLASNQSFKLSDLRRLDALGALLFLASSVCFVAALQEANASYSWGSPVVTALLVVSGVSVVSFTLRERFISLKSNLALPILSWQFSGRRSIGLFMTSLLIGGPFTCSVIQIPQRYQILNGLSPYESGVRLLAFILMVPVGTIPAIILAEKLKISHIACIILGTAFQLGGAIGFALLPFSTEIQRSQYGFQVLLGLGSGISNVVATNAIPKIYARADISTALGANTQFRYLGGAIILGLVTTILNSDIRPNLANILPPASLEVVLETTEAIESLPEATRLQVLQAFSDSFSLQWKVLIGVIGAQVLTALMII